MNTLICDESQSDVRELTDILDYSYGAAMSTKVFYKASDALSYIRRGAPVDVCFVELVMQEMNGIELARALRADGYEGSLIFISHNRAFGPATYEVHALDYLLKPIMPEDVRNAINTRRNPK